MNEQIASLRDFVKRYVELANSPRVQESRALWTDLNSLTMRKPLIYMRAVPYNEFFDFSVIRCQDPLLRHLETQCAQAVLYHQLLRDDFVYEPWLIVPAAECTSDESRWGVPVHLGEKPQPGGAAAYKPSLSQLEDIQRLSVRPHAVDEQATSERLGRVQDAVGDLTDIHVCRIAPLTRTWQMDLSTDIAKLRGLEQIMWDAYDNPEWLHRLLAFMRDAVLQAIDETEAAGDYSLADHQNQAFSYCRELPPPDCRVRGVRTKQLWTFLASQEFTTFGPKLFDEFMLTYQQPIMERFGMSSYGCCEDLTDKIGLLRRVKGLRRIAVSPFARVRRCAELIGGDYVISYRPDPSAMIARGLDEPFVRRTMREAFAAFKENGCVFDVTLKDVETISGKPDNMIRWVQIVREEIDRAF